MDKDKIVRQPIISVLGHIDHGKCFHPKTVIHTNFGRKYPKNIGKKTRILTYNEKYTYEKPLKIEKKYHEGYLYLIKTKDKDVVIVTPEHRFFTQRGWIPAKNLEKKDLVFGITKKSLKEIKFNKKFLKLCATAKGIFLEDLEYSDDKQLYNTLSKSKFSLNIEKLENYNIKNKIKKEFFESLCKKEIYNIILPEIRDNYSFKKIEKIRRIKYEGFVYDICMPSKNFFANNILLHNTTLIDAIRNTLYHKKEEGGITQHIGATEIPKNIIKSISKKILEAFKFKLEIPGILIVDTPGHEAFLSTRERGSSIADLAILVVDINKGFQDQTHESLKLLIEYRVPFVVAATKIDTIYGWKPQKTYYFLESIRVQDKAVISELDKKIYSIVASLSEYGFDAERFDRVQDFKREVSIIPVSGITKEGIAELLAIVSALSQKFLGKKLIVDLKELGKGTILEVKEEKGLGVVLDSIIYDGIVRERDFIIYPSISGVKISIIKAIYKYKPLQESRYKPKLDRVKEVFPACGVRLVLRDVENPLAGAPFFVTTEKNKVEELKKKLSEEVKKYIFESDNEGIIVKADTLGTLEGLIRLLKKNDVKIRKAGIGIPTKEDVLEASSMLEKRPEYGVIIVFGLEVPQDILEMCKTEGVKVIKGNIIYKIVEEYLEFVETLKKSEEEKLMESLILPCRFKIIPGFVFRQHSPAIVGIEILDGVLKTNVTILRESDGKKVGIIKSIQKERKSVKIAKKGDRVAVMIEGGYVGRNLKEHETYIVDIPESHFKIIKSKLLDKLSKEEIDILKKIARIYRKTNPTWGL